MSKRNRQVSESVSDVINAATAPATENPKGWDSVEPGPEQTATATKPKSIRSLVMGMILAGKPTKEIAASIKEHFPGTAADTKSAKHIAWYRSRMRKDGQLPPKGAETPAVDAATAS